MNKNTKKLLPLAVLIVSILIAFLIIKAKPEIETKPISTALKQVRTIKIEKQPVSMSVYTQGTIVPRTETALVAQVGGLITSISPAFASGGFFEKGDILVWIDDSDYKLAEIQAELQVAQAELSLNMAEREAEVAVLEWNRLNNGTPPALVARKPQLKEALAALEAAKASLKQTQLNIERTKIRAPYSGRIRIKSVDIGQYVNPGMTVANIYAVDYAEVRLPIPDSELAYIDFPINFKGLQNRSGGPVVRLNAEFAGKQREWTGYLARIEGEIDPRSRMIYAVARVVDPYGMRRTNDLPPLTVGMFVHATIEGKVIQDIAVVPRSAIRSDNQVLVVNGDNRLRFRNIEILRNEADLSYILSGLEDGELVCISNLSTVVDGMPVKLYQEGKEDSDTESAGGDK